jgi:multiple sugar transport system permease protein
VIAVTALAWWLYPWRNDASSANVTEVTIWFNGPLEGRHNDVVDAFERVFPEYRGILGSSAARTGLEGEGNPQRLMCGIAGGVPPEVVEYDRFAIAQWAARNAFLDLTSLIEKDRKELDDLQRKVGELEARGAPAAELDAARQLLERHKKYDVRREDYYAPTWEECMYEGGQYGVPLYMDDRALYYSTDLLEQAGIVDAQGRAQPPTTWEQMLHKVVDVTDSSVRGNRITSASGRFGPAGVRAGDSVSVMADERVRRCIVAEVIGPGEISVKSAYANKPLELSDGAGRQVKVFDQDSIILRLSRWDEDGRLKVVGFEPMHGNGWLFNYAWLNGGEFLSPDGRKCTMNEPRIVEALHFTTDVYDAMGGVAEVNAFKKSFQTAAQDPFFLNQIGMFVQGDWFLRDLARYKRDMRFGVAPPPQPAARAEAGNKPVTFLAGFALCIPATCPPDKLEAAWWLAKYLASVDGGMIMDEHDAQRERAQGRLYMPRLMGNRLLNEKQLAAYVNIPEMPERVRTAMQTHIDLLADARYRPVSPEGQKLWNAQADAQDLAWNHKGSVQAVLDQQSQKVQRSLDLFHARSTGPEMRWGPLVAVYAAIVFLTVGFVFLRFRATNTLTGYHGRQWWVGVVFILPWLLGFLVLAGGPMLFSLVLSATRYDVISPARFVAAQNYTEMFTVDWASTGGVRQALLNTLFMAIGLPLSMMAGLALAMLLNTEVKGMSVYRTTFFLPAIMPVVAASVLWIWVFNSQNGLLNWILGALHFDWVLEHIFGLNTPVSWLTNQATSKPALIIMTLWGSGATMIIWLAGLKEIPKHLYEAAALDGAGVVRRFFNVTLPMLSPYILFNLIMGLIQTFQVFTQAYIMTPNGSPARSTYFYVYKLFDECFSFFRLGYGAAMAWVLFAIVIGLTLINMWSSKKWVHYAGE